MSKELMLEAAVGYAANGFPVLPVKKMDKEPAIKGGYMSATVDPDLARDWWEGKYPGCNIGIATGDVSQFWVLDVDVKPEANGMSTLERLMAVHGPLPQTATQITGSGGRHYLFRMPDNDNGVKCSVKKLGPGLDVRGNGGYIVVAPSIHPDTRQEYRWESGQFPTLADIAEAPSWLIDLVSNDNKPGGTKPPSGPSHDGGVVEGTASPAYIEAALNGECLKIEQASSGSQQATLNSAAFNIGTLVGRGALEHGVAIDRLCEAAMRMPSHNRRDPWTSRGIRSTIERALSDGMKHPRQLPITAIRSTNNENDGGSDWRDDFEHRETGHQNTPEDLSIPVEIRKLNAKHAAILIGSRFVILTERMIPGKTYPSLSYLSPTDLKWTYYNQWMVTEGGPKKLERFPFSWHSRIR